jgi:ribonuclease Z
LQITFLGTSSGVPTRSRNVSAVALRLPQRGEVWLFDCGEGTQQQFLKSGLSISQLRRIFITHMHGDHVFGLMGLLATCGMAGNHQGIDVYGPPDLQEYLALSGKYSKTHLSYPVEVHTVEPGPVYEDDEFRVGCAALKHRVPAFGYRITEKDRAGRFDVERAAAMGIPSGPLFGRLKRGETITLDDGRELNGADFCGPTQKGRRVVYCTDTLYCESAVELARDADLLIHEATYAHVDEELAYRGMHSTSVMAARVAAEAGVRQLIMTHFSPRYAPGGPLEPNELLREARVVFPETEMAHDFMTVDVARNQPRAEP